jgi:Fumarase C C-terminus
LAILTASETLFEQKTTVPQSFSSYFPMPLNRENNSEKSEFLGDIREFVHFRPPQRVVIRERSANGARASLSGYEIATKTANDALQSGRTIRNIVVENGLLGASETDDLLDPGRMLGR